MAFWALIHNPTVPSRPSLEVHLPVEEPVRLESSRPGKFGSGFDAQRSLLGICGGHGAGIGPIGGY